MKYYNCIFLLRFELNFRFKQRCEVKILKSVTNMYLHNAINILLVGNINGPWFRASRVH